MGFWKNVEERRNYLGITRKDLALKAGIKYAAIGAGLERDSMPAANTAFRISKALNIPLEVLLDDDFSSVSHKNNKFDSTKLEYFLNKYWDVLRDLENLPLKIRHTMIETIHKLSIYM